MNRLAVVFDFDDTLVPDSTSQFLAAHGVDPEAFYGGPVRAMVERGYDAPLAYLQALLDEVGPDRRFGALTNADLREFGARLDDTYFPGLPGLFEDLRAEVASYNDVAVDFYVISSGIQSLIEGSAVIRDHVRAVYACELEEGPQGWLRYLKRCVTFTEKTRYLFEINKGIPREAGTRNPGLVNVRVDHRPVPFPHMVYVGDGLTDIPCFSLVHANGGIVFGVFDPTKPANARRALQEFLKAGRTMSTHAPRFRPDDELGAFLRAAVRSVCERIQLEAQQARPF